MALTTDNLFLAIEKNENEDVKQFLLDKGVDIIDEYGRTPLINAAFYDNQELIKWLLDKGANKDFQDNIGYTALHFAAQESHLDSAKILLNNGVNPDVQDIHGNTPSWVTVMNWKGGENFDLLQELTKNNANLEVKNKVGKTTKELIPDEIMTKLTR